MIHTKKTAHKNNPYINTALKTKINKTNTTKTLGNVNETKYVWQKRRSQEPKKPNKKQSARGLRIFTVREFSRCWQNWQLTNLILHTMLCMDRIGHLRGWHFRSNAAHKLNKKHNNTHFVYYSTAQHSIEQYSSYTNFWSIFNAFQECTCFGIYTVVVSDG